jgi:peptide-methionine (R)-S-oxide reductase
MNDRRSFLILAGGTALGLALAARQSVASPVLRPTVAHTPAEWLRILGPRRYHVLRESGTERAFTSPLLNEHRHGIFTCAGCSLPLFSSATKFESGTGWPSFWKALPHAVAPRGDRSLRDEVLCARCAGHLGHVFDDGPRPTGLRYCMNGLALNFRAG